MATSQADPLRSTLDNLELDPRSAADRPYLVAMLRRLGYTERDIEETLRTGKLPEQAAAQQAAQRATDLAPARDYRLVVPPGGSVFALDNEGRAGGTDQPFEDLERVEFEDPSEDVAFESVEDDETEPAKGLQWQDTQGADTAAFDESAIDTFGDPDAVAGGAKTRVRVRRVRAASREEAERKVSGGGRNVIKSVPVDIVERWGAEGAGKGKGGQS